MPRDKKLSKGSKSLSLRVKMLLILGLPLIVSLLMVTQIHLYLTQQRSKEDLIAFREAQVESAENKLRSVVDMVEGYLSNADQLNVPMEDLLEQLRLMRYDNGDGYFWIIDDQLPFPNLLFHATHPGNEGQPTDDPKFEIITDQPGKNFHQEIVKACLDAGEAYTDYFWVRPVDNFEHQKMAYSKYIKEKRIIISSGIYVDQIDVMVRAKEEAIAEYVSRTILFSAVSAVIILLISFFIAWYFSSNLVAAMLQVKHLLHRLVLGEQLEAIHTNRKDEMGEMVKMVNETAGRIQEFAAFANQISEGHLEVELELNSDKDLLGVSLVRMQRNLMSATEEIKSTVAHIVEEGDVSVQLSTENKQGVWLGISQLFNELTKTVGNSFLEISKLTSSMSQGDLSVRMGAGWKGDMKVVSDSLNKALEQLNILIAQIIRNAGEVNGLSDEILSNSEQMRLSTSEVALAVKEMSQGAGNQVVKVDESSKLMEESLNSSMEIKEQADRINHAAKQGVADSQDGLALITQVNESMRNISTSAQESRHSFEVLNDRSNEIGKVLSFITEIASQTNLLALNAAIEAAQAGEAGRGFAVVADEIRKLAEESRNSAKEIELLINDVQQGTNEALQSMFAMGGNVEKATQTTQNAYDAFKKMASSSEETLQLTERILSASQMQIDNTNEVVAITESIVVIAEETASGTEEVATSASQLSSVTIGFKDRAKLLSEIATTLQESAEQFKLNSDV
jgi:methyl-accepting chemotaxis protein